MVGVRLDEPVFPNTVGGLRDPSNTRRELRDARGRHVGVGHFTQLPQTVATILDRSGHSGRQVADQLGHSRPSMTMNVYLGRKVANPGASVALEQFINHEDLTRSPDEKHG